MPILDGPSAADRPGTMSVMNSQLVDRGRQTRGGAAALEHQPRTEIAAEDEVWIWPGRIPLGELTLIIGDPGVGKSLLLTECAARITTGTPWPDGAPSLQGNVLILSAEDPSKRVCRRLDAAGDDPRRVHLARTVRDASGRRLFRLDRDLPALEHAIEETRAIAVMIDPLSAYLGACDSYKDAEVRALFARLAEITDRHGVAVIGVMHLTKSERHRAIYRAQGSIAFTGNARSVLAVEVDPKDRERRLLVAIKNNLEVLAPALAFRVVKSSGSGAPRIVWESESVKGVDAERLLTLEADEERRAAEVFLRNILADGEVPAADVLRAARENWIPQWVLYRARVRLGVRSRRVGGLGSQGSWYWSLPKIAPPSPAFLGEGPEKTVGSPKIAPPRIAPPSPAFLGEVPEKTVGSPKIAPPIHRPAFLGEGPEKTIGSPKIAPPSPALLGEGPSGRQGGTGAETGHPTGAAQGAVAPPAASAPYAPELQAAILERGARLGWIRLPIAPGRAVAAGEDGWRKFVAHATPEDLIVVLRALGLRDEAERCQC